MPGITLIEGVTMALAHEMERDEYGFILTDKTLETTLPGVFAAGDVRAGATNQAASAAGEGAPSLPATLGRPIPHMSEPWYCCAEPTDQQLQSF